MSEELKPSSNGKQKNSITLQIDDFASLIPEKARGMTKIDKDIYNVNAVLPAIKCKAKSCGKFLSMFKNILLKRPHFRKVIPSDEKDYRIILLDPSSNLIEKLNEEQQNIITEEQATFYNEYSIQIGYKDFSFSEIIQSILPEDAESINSFETIGHIAHVNLKSHLHEYKYVIGEVLMDKNVHIKTVVNKTDSINTEFRFFEMEVLAGEEKMKTSVSEHGCVFEFDYSKVYWNSRLHSEHQRLVDKLKPGDIVYDVFAGVGPFAIPAAKKDCCVYANDLNKASYDSLLHNAKLNKVDTDIQAFNLDGREFLRDNLLKNINQYKDKTCTIHIIMNLPAIAPEFLDIFKDTFDHPIEIQPDIIAHCYCFSKSKTPEIDAEQTVANMLGLHDISTHSETHFVRRVAPNKVMLCVSLYLFWFKENYHSSSKISRKRCLSEAEDVVNTKRLTPIPF